MAKKTSRQSNKSAAKNPSKKSNLPLVITAVVITCVAAGLLFFGDNSGSDNSESVKARVIAVGESLTIPTADISGTASFYPVEVDGTAMEVLAVRASDGTIRTAFNTCQSCYTSGRGYYVQEGNDLVCQNCGFHFTPDQVEVQSGGCNPWPIFAENKTVTAESIQIAYDFLLSSSSIFANWRAS